MYVSYIKEGAAKKPDTSHYNTNHKDSSHIHEAPPPCELRYMLDLDQPHANGDEANHRATKPLHTNVERLYNTMKTQG